MIYSNPMCVARDAGSSPAGGDLVKDLAMPELVPMVVAMTSPDPLIRR